MVGLSHPGTLHTLKHYSVFQLQCLLERSMGLFKTVYANGN